MIELYKNIKKRRTELKMTQSDLAKKAGYADKSMIAKIEKGQVDLQTSKISALAKALNTTSKELMGYGSRNDTLSEVKNIQQPTNIFKMELKRFPLVGEIACGNPIFSNEDRESYIFAVADIHADFCLKVKGDSMINARIYDGDIVFIKKQDMVENGDIAAVVVNGDNEATLKRFYYYIEKSMLILKPENPAYEDQIYIGSELEQVHVLGRAVAFQSDI